MCKILKNTWNNWEKCGKIEANIKKHEEGKRNHGKISETDSAAEKPQKDKRRM